MVSWNIAKKREPWRQLAQMDADVALLQEATPPPDHVVQLREATPLPGEVTATLDIGPREAWGLAFLELRLVAAAQAQ